ncbi:MAG TPA: SulP family inorganic anion transporter [Caulobacteraceae bacterium]|jgi:MFS superfamily sulfate permease-like transporter
MAAVAAHTDKVAAWPVLRGLQGVSAATLTPDLIAGLTLAAIAVPEQMATARLGGLAPSVGLMAFVAATVGFAVFGASKRLSAGADSTITPIFAGSLAALVTTGHSLGGLAAALALLVGVLLAVAGALRLGWVADLLSRPVLTGFLAGIALHIVLSQAPAVLGLPEESGDVYHRVPALVAALGQMRPAALAVGAGVFAVTWGAEKLNARLPGALVALVAATAATAWLGLGRFGVATLGAAAGGLPAPALPRLGIETAVPLVSLAFVITLVVMVQSAATARSFAEEADPDIDRDYLGLGAANALAGLCGAMPVNASPPRTAATAEAGGRTQVAGLVAAAGVLALALWGRSLLALAPSAALAGVLLFVAQRIFHVGDFVRLLRRTPAEFALAALTTAFIVLLPIQTGVAVGVFLSLAHGVFIITRARLIPFERAPGTTIWWPVTPDHRGETEPGVLVMGFQAPLSFLNAYDFRRDLTAAVGKARGQARLLVLEASSIVEVDFTAAEILSAAIDEVRAAGLDMALARLESVRAETALARFGVLEKLGPGHLFQSVEQAIRAMAPQSVAG